MGIPSLPDLLLPMYSCSSPTEQGTELDW